MWNSQINSLFSQGIQGIQVEHQRQLGGTPDKAESPRAFGHLNLLELLEPNMQESCLSFLSCPTFASCPIVPAVQAYQVYQISQIFQAFKPFKFAYCHESSIKFIKEQVQVFRRRILMMVKIKAIATVRSSVVTL